MNQEPKKSAVFEMILNAKDGADAKASAEPSRMEISDDWHSEHVEGQLAIDVAETRDEIVVISTMAGALTDKIEVFIHHDLLTVRGSRNFPLPDKNLDFFYRECFWGKFSRTIVLPSHVKGDAARAEYKNGVLLIRAPKQVSGGKVPITIIEE